jgi:hypothetical protein
MESVDDLGVVDPVEVDGGDPEIGVPERRWLTSNGTPRVTSRRRAWRSWWGAKRRRDACSDRGLMQLHPDRGG